MRATVAYLPGDQDYAGGAGRRCEATQIAHGRCGRIWPSDTLDNAWENTRSSYMHRARASVGRWHLHSRAAAAMRRAAP
eukprot:4218082-Pyramimonas_sp.AAC.1